MTAPMTPAHTLGLLPVETLCAARAELAAEDQENRADVQRRDNKRKSVCASLSLFFFWSCASTRVKRWEEHRKTSVLTSSVCGVYFLGKTLLLCTLDCVEHVRDGVKREGAWWGGKRQPGDAIEQTQQ